MNILVLGIIYTVDDAEHDLIEKRQYGCLKQKIRETFYNIYNRF